MQSDKEAQVLDFLSSNLSTSLSDLISQLDRSKGEITKILDNLEASGLVHHTRDAVTEEDYYSPTPKAAVKRRR